MLDDLERRIMEAAVVVGKTWPLYSFVTASPLAGYEHLEFFDALKQAGGRLGADLLPGVAVLEAAWLNGEIDAGVLDALLTQAGLEMSAEQCLHRMRESRARERVNGCHELDLLTVKWLSLFLDEGMAAWPMPFKEMGFFTAWRKLFVFDRDVAGRCGAGGDIPKTPLEALEVVLRDFNEYQCTEIFKAHLAALPGWTGYIKYRVEQNGWWHRHYPVSLLDYLAVRLWMARCLDCVVLSQTTEKQNESVFGLRFLWMKAWEQTWQRRLAERISAGTLCPGGDDGARRSAQLVFCLDTRSELLRRVLEGLGDYETFGAAGSFGVPMDYEHPASGYVNKSSPEMVPSEFVVKEMPLAGSEERLGLLQRKWGYNKAYRYFLKRLKNILPSAFGFVEGAGLFYGVLMLLRLFAPALARKMMDGRHGDYEELYEPCLFAYSSKGELRPATLGQQATLVKGFLDACGFRHFAPLVILTGHASHSTNNAFASSLDCGACAGHSGKSNARMMARMANDPEVRRYLREVLGRVIPEDCFFMAAEHITSEDRVRIFNNGVPATHRQGYQRLCHDLWSVRELMAAKRLQQSAGALPAAMAKSSRWSETRPEWGLSGHAGYIIGPRSLTRAGNFNDCFLSSYDWSLDNEGAILKGIMQGPLVVVQWISSHYYFSTVDNQVLGGGSKITQNITGGYGVVQGNGSDLKMGLPLQSLMVGDDRCFHRPVRPTVLIEAPVEWVEGIVRGDKRLSRLVGNGWMHLMIMDPLRDNRVVNFKMYARMERV